MPWKKCYHRLLKDDAEAKRMMLEQMQLADMLQIDHYLPSLVRLVFKHACMQPAKKMCCSHPQKFFFLDQPNLT